MKFFARQIRQRLARAVTAGAFEIHVRRKLFLLRLIRRSGGGRRLVLGLHFKRAVEIRRETQNHEQNYDDDFKMKFHRVGNDS